MYSAVAHRRSKRPQAATFHEHVGVEIAWTVIPFIILIFHGNPGYPGADCHG
jgi:cytochrome c oxidase subunit II